MSHNLDLKHPATWLATWFGSGLINPAPGTWGTLAALPFGCALLWLDNTPILLAAIAFVTALGLWSASVMEKQTGLHDDKRIVIDEVAGQWIALIPATLNPLSILLAFALFRLFDILKPWPISVADKRIKGSLGVMLDDIIAGAIAGFLVLLFRFIF